MKYKYLKEWYCKELIDLEIKSFQKYQDQYLITFFKSKLSLQISLNQGNAFMFCTDNDTLPAQEERSLSIFNHLLNRSRLQSISLLEGDRIFLIELRKRDIYNEIKDYVLICECAANFENLIICEREGDDLIIVDCLKKFSFAENNQRQILPKMVWQAPQTSFIPQTGEIAYKVDIIDGKITEGLDSGFDNMNSLFEEFYYNTILNRKKEQLQKSLLSNINSQLKKAVKKLKKQEAELLTAQDEEKWLQYAELLKSSLHEIKTGMKEITLTNYYESDLSEITIPLFEDKSPLENSNYYFKKYKKSKTGQKFISEQIKKTKQEIVELEQEAAELKEEESYLNLVELTASENYRKRELDHKVYFRRLKIDESWEIFIGRSSKENDLLTCKVAKGHDWWFHTRVFQGTHVVLRNYANKQLPDKYRILCAQLAAYYSKAKTSENVPVDYTQIRFVRKPRGSAPGYVTYKNQKTIYVNPLDYREAMVVLGIN